MSVLVLLLVKGLSEGAGNGTAVEETATTSTPLADITEVLNYLSGISGAAFIAAALVSLSSAYIVGYASRSAAFSMLRYYVGVRKFVRWMGALIVRKLCDLWRWLKVGLSNSNSDGVNIDPAKSKSSTSLGETNLEDLVRLFSASAVSDIVNLHPVLQKYDSDASGGSRSVGGGNEPTLGFDVFEYCKFWLQRYCPDMSLRAIEVDINVLVSATVPVALTGFYAGSYWSNEFMHGLLGLIPAILLLRIAARKQRTERWGALRNFAMDYLIRLAAQSYPPDIKKYESGLAS
ncbi:hypothetical protein HT102_02420 [Hoyosella sp. G463]|uniref:Uncharacterized protein n=1 Tax=Lolliginicoccus lacisalsi TaxID=2742202 RepID=A0A927PLG0_9ACTN|nr:hypothetical protein [Lolliginicoccus lacisalsi]MBD8505342.1 hypothetical protein [Lolliginicoccus lacisalsi]